MSDLPIGWDNRTNQMSEKDMKLGGMAATRFASRSSAGTSDGAYQDVTDGQYKTSEQVRAHYHAAMETSTATSSVDNSNKQSSSVLPDLWSDRQQERGLQVLQMGVFLGKKNDNATPSVVNDMSEAVSHFSGKARHTVPPRDGRNNPVAALEKEEKATPQVALVQVATNALETLANIMDGHPSPIPMEERTALANAMKRVMDVLAKQTV